MIEDLKALNVNYNLYLPKVESNFKCSNDFEQMVKDFDKICEITGVNFNEKAARKAINAYRDFFTGAPVSIRTTTKPVDRFLSCI